MIRHNLVAATLVGVSLLGAAAASVLLVSGTAHAQRQLFTRKFTIKHKGSDSFIGSVDVHHGPTGKRDGEHAVSLTWAGKACTGVGQHDPSHRGTFSFRCADGSSASGTCALNRGTSKISGEGVYRKANGDPINFVLSE
jgi:hypothetical protein